LGDFSLNLICDNSIEALFVVATKTINSIQPQLNDKL